MVKIRLTRIGKKNAPSYRVVVVPLREKRDSKFIEILGHFSPRTKVFEVKEDRVKYWLSVGAQPSDTVRAQLVKKGILKAEVKKTFNKAPGKQSQERAAKKAAVKAE
jgi:small subunit ribosomal protein S16